MKEQISYVEHEGGEAENSPFNTMQQVKRDFFSLRNGVVADVLRKGGSGFKVIFGLNLPQLVELSRKYGPDRQLACDLWKNSTTRCSMLLAPMLMPLDTFRMEEALQWCKDITEVEVADILCSRLLVATDFATCLVKELSAGTEMEKYVAMRLAMNLIKRKKIMEEGWEILARREIQSANPSNRLLAVNLLEEIEFFTER